MTEIERVQRMIDMRMERAAEHEAKGDHQRAANCRYLADIHRERLAALTA